VFVSEEFLNAVMPLAPHGFFASLRMTADLFFAGKRT